MRIHENTRVVVTGGAGVIGRELLSRLCQRKAQVLCLDRSPLVDHDRQYITHRQLDLSQRGIPEARDHRPDVLFHLAASFERSREGSDFWDVNYRDNIQVSHRIAELCATTPSLGTVVFASSYLVYSPELYLSSTPRPEPTMLAETSTLGPRNLCGSAKLYAESEFDFVRTVARPNLRTVHARIFRVYGIGSRDIISRWISGALSGSTLDIYNRQNRFDYIYAGDVAEALLRLAESDTAQGIVNVGTGRARSIEEVVQTLKQMVPDAWLRTRDNGVTEAFEASAANIARLVELTGYSPPTTLEQGMGYLLSSAKAQKTARDASSPAPPPSVPSPSSPSKAAGEGSRA